MYLLRDKSWRISYSSDEHNPVTDFYIPALECAIRYDRKSGFFNSSVLGKVARGLGAMLDNGGQMRLIMGCQFSPQDLQAIRQGYELREVLNSRLDTCLEPPKNFAQLKHFEILSWLIQNQFLDIRIVVPLKTDGTPEESQEQLNPNRIFHEKVGIITDRQGEQLAFNGSNNESIGGWSANIESFHVFLAWQGDRDYERVQLEITRFEKLWHNQMPNVKVFEVPEAVTRKLLHYAPVNRPDWNRQNEFDTRPIVNTEPLPKEPKPVLPKINQQQLEKEYQAFLQLNNLYQHPGCLDFSLQSIPVKPWPHQQKILRRIAREFPCSYLIADEVGLGKTIETGLVLRYLILSQKVKRVLVLSPASVQPQWHEELREKFNLHFWSYSEGKLQDPYKQSISLDDNPWNTKDFILASSHLIRRQERMQELLAAKPWDLVVLDEAHHARRKSPQNRQDTPNRLLELMGNLRANTKALLLLSATPMQIDTIEVFDLLKLVGLQGYWSYGDSFCEYFSTLPESANQNLLNFWQQMSTDYFQKNGKPSPRFQQHLEQKDKILAYRLDDIWRSGRRIMNHKQLLDDEPFITTSRQYLSINTPLKDLMFRHTRDTLREYYRLGLLKQDVPTREVYDNAITLEPLREVPLYRAVSDYVRHFYRLAQKENRKALGFLMTLYRKRLTSSFYAIRESLQRRLDGINVLTPDDLSDLDDAEDAVIEGLEYLQKPTDPKEIEYLQDLLSQFENTGEDTKFSQFLTRLREELTQRESAIVFTQYTDTMDYLRNELKHLYGSLLACYSGRGGELYRNGKWYQVAKEEIKQRFRSGEIKILLCTESASEGLNLQTCGVLFNYDLPWNPMRVEQRIGRIDRIGQRYPTVRIQNFYYDGTVEAKVYRKLRDRINAFANVVGNLQPILAKVPTFLERAVMSADPEEEDVLLSEFDHDLESPQLLQGLDDMIAKDVESDSAEITKPIPSAPITAEEIEQLFTTSLVLKYRGVVLERTDNNSDKIWKLEYKNKTYQVTFYPDVFDEKPSLRLMTFGEPLFQELIQAMMVTCQKLQNT